MSEHLRNRLRNRRNEAHNPVKADERHPRQDEKRARALLKKASATDLTTIGDRVKVGLPATFGGVSWLSLALFNLEQAVF